MSVEPGTSAEREAPQEMAGNDDEEWDRLDDEPATAAAPGSEPTTQNVAPLADANANDDGFDEGPVSASVPGWSLIDRSIDGTNDEQNSRAPTFSLSVCRQAVLPSPPLTHSPFASLRVPSLVRYPEALKNLRCCIACRLVKTLEQFYQQGCENCHFLNLEGDRERIEDCTTTEFQGMLGVVDPNGSWATRYAFMQQERVPGVYSLAVDHTNLRPEIRELFEDNGVKLQN